MNFTKADNRFISVPNPSVYHWWDGLHHLPWQQADPTHPKSSGTIYRNITAVYLGSTLTMTAAHTKIRRAVTSQCSAHKACHWKRVFHSSTDDRIADFLSSYQHATFCLNPPGDDPSRKGIFDSIVAGCIPVIFDVSTVYNQFPWHLSEQIALDVSVFIPGRQVVNGLINFMEVMYSKLIDLLIMLLFLIIILLILLLVLLLSLIIIVRISIVFIISLCNYFSFAGFNEHKSRCDS